MCRSAGDQSCRHSAGDGLERLESQFFCRDTELHQFCLVHPNGIVVGLGRMVYAVLEILDGQVLIFD